MAHVLPTRGTRFKTCQVARIAMSAESIVDGNNTGAGLGLGGCLGGRGALAVYLYDLTEIGGDPLCHRDLIAPRAPFRTTVIYVPPIVQQYAIKNPLEPVIYLAPIVQQYAIILE